MAREMLQHTAPIFPIGNDSSRRAFDNFFPLYQSETYVNDEKEIMRKHYENTYLFLSLVSVSKQNIGVMQGMFYLHNAARLEAQTRRAFLPQITDNQLVSFFNQASHIELTFSPPRISRIDYENIEADFKSKELAMNSTINRRLSGSPFHNGVLSGCALMWDFLKMAPTLPSTMSFAQE